MCLETIGITGEIDVITDPEYAILGAIHVVLECALADGDDLVGNSTFIHEHQDGIVPVSLDCASHLSHLTLDDGCDLLLLFVVGDTHALVLILKRIGLV